MCLYSTFDLALLIEMFVYILIYDFNIKKITALGCRKFDESSGFFNSDCPNTFVHLNNKCYAMSRSPMTFDSVAHECSVKASVVFTPTTETERLVANTLMEMYQVDVIFAGIVQGFSDSWKVVKINPWNSVLVI